MWGGWLVDVPDYVQPVNSRSSNGANDASEWEERKQE